jgi:outer membrane protein TolC
LIVTDKTLTIEHKILLRNDKKIRMYKTLISLSLSILISSAIFGQKTGITRLSLESVIQLAKEKSIAARQAATRKETAFWRYQNFLSNYKPQLTLNGVLPNFNRAYKEVLQPDGSIDFQPVTNNNSSLNFSLNQSIAATGATIFVNSELQRFDDFDRDFTLYNGLPIGIGIEQPLFAYNALKWDKKTEPLYNEESKQLFKEDLETIALNAANRFFDFLIAQVNLEIAQSNLSNNDTLYKIALERFDLGKISKNDVLRMQLEVLKTKKSVANALQNLEVSGLQLKSYIAYRETDIIELILPSEIPHFRINKQQALQEALSNRSAAIGFKTRDLEAQKAIAKAKGETGFQANIFAAVGLSNSATRAADIYKSPQDRETIQIGFSLPILDWGRAKSKVGIAEAQQQLVAFEIEQDRIVFEEEIYTLITLFDMLAAQLTLSEEADKIAANRYEIAKNRFLIGNLSITDLTIAAQEKDQAKRDYIYSLRDFWTTHLTIRLKTLFDFEKKQKI